MKLLLELFCYLLTLNIKKLDAKYTYSIRFSNLKCPLWLSCFGKLHTELAKLYQEQKTTVFCTLGEDDMTCIATCICKQRKRVQRSDNMFLMQTKIDIQDRN